MDTSVRNCWQIDSKYIRLGGLAWQDTFNEILQSVAASLGPPAERLRAELYKLLLYEPEGFFTEHRDTKKADGMIG